MELSSHACSGFKDLPLYFLEDDERSEEKGNSASAGPPSAATSIGGMTLFQNQCFLHSSIISSMGTPLVSGRKT
ncbi:hypothetical protein C4D60_Mb09t11990 [Musa balbisiana]|uniref:Uncharacterized protein n=1 Tax=Musa balbisiana TaxID=52838 RepID=A0A4S8II84_MUSBA|nr:hypothetical protein C4D60_Mb09t11990 [Musa balbisiana]